MVNNSNHDDNLNEIFSAGEKLIYNIEQESSLLEQLYILEQNNETLKSLLLQVIEAYEAEVIEGTEYSGELNEIILRATDYIEQTNNIESGNEVYENE